MNWFDSREDLEASALLGELSDLCECPPDTLRRAAKIAETFGFAFFDRLLCLAHRGCEPCGPNGGNGGEKFPPPPPSSSCSGEVLPEEYPGCRNVE